MRQSHIIVLNTCGIQSFDKRKTILNWIVNHVQTCLLQETCSSKHVENSWCKQWKLKVTYSFHTEAHIAGGSYSSEGRPQF